MNNSSLKKKYVISSCGCDVLMPFALMYLFYTFHCLNILTVRSRAAPKASISSSVL